MEDKPLNMAHQQHRRAEVYLRSKRFDEAVQCHENAAQLLLDAMKSTSSPKAVESISLQHSYHLKQQDLIKTRKEQYERVKKAMNHLKKLSRDPLCEITEKHTVQIEIYRTIQEADSLLEILSKPNELTSSDKVNDDNVVIATDALVELNSPKITGTKYPKDQHTVIEELQTVNKSLHTLVDKLIMSVELVKEENIMLRSRVEYLEEERRKYLGISNNESEMMQQTDFGLMTGVNHSPEENSDCSFPPNEFRAEITDNLSEHDIPSDKPNFDLSAFKNE